MLPPTNSSTLDRNPRFKALYQDLVNSRLNADGSSRLIKQQRAQAEIEKVSSLLYWIWSLNIKEKADHETKSLQVHRRDYARTQILQDALHAITESGDLPEEVVAHSRLFN